MADGNTVNKLDNALTAADCLIGDLQAALHSSSMTESIIILDIITMAADVTCKLKTLITAIESDRKE